MQTALRVAIIVLSLGSIATAQSQLVDTASEI
jgi:hypothetical protein